MKALGEELLGRLRTHVVSSTSDTATPVEVYTGADLATLPSARIFERFHALLLKHHEEFADLLQAETGKARRDAFEELGKQGASRYMPQDQYCARDLSA